MWVIKENKSFAVSDAIQILAQVDAHIGTCLEMASHF
jgi:hypothetical protein